MKLRQIKFNLLIKHGKKEVAKLYEGYRSIREFQRKSSNNIESQVSELLDGKSDYWNNENSNKNQNLVTRQKRTIWQVLLVQTYQENICYHQILFKHMMREYYISINNIVELQRKLLYKTR